MQEKTLRIKYQVFPHSAALPAQYSKLLDRAKASLHDSWSPYSEFRVGAAVELIDGSVFTGANQENAAYPMCLCAERVALAAAASGSPGVAPRVLAVTTARGNQPAAPCGACRQVISEQEYRFEQPVILLLGSLSGEVFVFDSVQDLLPFSFHSGVLNTL